MTSCDNIPTPSDFVDAARKYLDVPFMHQGRSLRGLDCLGLVVVAARDLGISVVDNLAYSKKPDFEEMRAGLLHHMAPVPSDDADKGDVIWLRWDRDGYPVHLAIISKIDDDGWPLVIHALGGKGINKVCEQRMPVDWVMRIHKFLRWHEWHN